MRDCIAIRTYTWGADEDRLVGELSPVFGDDLFVAFHNRPEGVTPPVPVADFDDDWVRSNGLRLLDDYGWRCGDYALYALRRKFPDYDRYWLIEPDVSIHGDIAGFFAGAARLDPDALGVDFHRQEQVNRFVKGLPDNLVPYRATFALTRFSGRALDYLFAARQDYSGKGTGSHRFTNDETFCFSHLVAHPGFTAGGLREALPEWFGLGLFDTDPDLLKCAVAARTGGRNQVCHPVREFDSFSGAVSKRIAANAHGFLKNMGLSFAHMSDAEIEALAQGVARRLREIGHQIRREHGA
ncbi:hypothetical protein [Celeribacter indicus]|uniref:Methyltransferase FkbM n=1 Tax=Celeribacter indicus TaxID=1208324 RepID=A0A0B5E0X5_9RHOB|nr:hypothetical protein [Celeribacter indicus]AJE47065.1 methyltransferase FkbM [Celeribacter indicus]SDW91792.1 hypothetical protein SAMN05443573_10986 [Celeribacter indicus]